MKLNIFCCFFGNNTEIEKDIIENIEPEKEENKEKIAWWQFVSEPISSKNESVEDAGEKKEADINQTKK